MARPRPGDPHRHRPAIAADRAGGGGAARDALADDIRTRGFDAAQGAYTAPTARPSSTPPCCSPCSSSNRRQPNPAVGTIDAIHRRLGAGGPLLYRYPPGTDGLAGGEGAFLPCSFWLVQALARTGRHGEAEACSTN